MLSTNAIFAIVFLAGAVVGALLTWLLCRKSTPAIGPQPEIRSFTLIIKDDEKKDYNFKVDVTNVKDAAGNEITDPAQLALLVEQHESSDPSIVTVTSTPGLGEGVVHPTGKAGQATQTAKVFANQAAVDSGANPLVIATEVWEVQTGAAVSAEAKFTFTPATPPPPPVP